MNTKKTLSLGWITAIAFILGTLILGSQLEDYRMISQTVSEIGENGSPLYLPYQILIITVAVLLILFGFATLSFAKENNLSKVPAILIVIFGFAELGSGAFPSPHPVHNMMGIFMMIGFFAPLLFFIKWKNALGQKFKTISLISFILIIIGMFLNLTPIFAPTLYPLEYYGLVQRFLLFTIFLYCAYLSIRLINFSSKSTSTN